MFVDRTVSPSYGVDVAQATRDLVERRAPDGLYHCVNSGSCTWQELAREVARQLASSRGWRWCRMDEVRLQGRAAPLLRPVERQAGRGRAS